MSKPKVTVQLTQRQFYLLGQLDKLYGDTRPEKLRTILSLFLGGAVRWQPPEMKQAEGNDVQ